MVRLLPRTGTDVSYYLNDPAAELDGVRSGPAGRWLRGDGPVDSDRVEAVLRTTPRARVTGYDIVVAAPRPLSMLLAIDPDAAPVVVASHQRAVQMAVGYLEERAVVVRQRFLGHDVEDPAQWGAIASFTHGVNRQGEPHLHDHVIVGALPKGERTVLDRRSLQHHLATADALYRAVLRDDVGRQTSWTPWQSARGIDHVGGLDEGYRALWGGHFAERGTKRRWTREEIVRKWESDLRSFTPLATVPVPPRPRGQINEYAFGRALRGESRLDRPRLLAAWCNAATYGAPADELQGSFDRYYPQLVQCRGFRSRLLSPREALMVAHVNEYGNRTLTTLGLNQEAAPERVPQRHVQEVAR